MAADSTLLRCLPDKILAHAPIASFDFDSTLRPYRGKGPDEDLTARLLAKLARSFNVVIFSNRSCKTDKSKKPILEYLDLVDSFSGTKHTVAAWAALGQSSPWRKATTNMWTDYLRTLNCQLTPAAYAGSYYCGDAAGRLGDHAATDYCFARNIGIRFLTPEQVFANDGSGWLPPDYIGCEIEAHYDKKDLDVLGGAGVAFDDLQYVAQETLGRAGADAKIFILLVGAPASGKTTFATRLAVRTGIAHLDEVDMRTFPKKAVGLPRIVADATHPTAARRKVVLDWARSHGYRTLIVHMETSKKLCEHLNMARAELMGSTLIPIIAQRVYWKNLEPPEKSEADDGVIRTTFWPAENAPPEVTEFRY